MDFILLILALAIGFCAWAFGAAGIFTPNRSTALTFASFLCCLLPLVLVLFYVYLLVSRHGGSALLDIIGGLTFGAQALIAGTLMLNTIALLRRR